MELVEVLPPNFAIAGLHAQLGIRPGAPKEEVKAAYKKVFLRLHPDKNQNNQKRATELFKQLNAEYENWKRTAA